MWDLRAPVAGVSANRKGARLWGAIPEEIHNPAPSEDARRDRERVNEAVRQWQAETMAEIIPRANYLGKPRADPPAEEAEHFVKCPACGGLQTPEMMAIIQN